MVCPNLEQNQPLLPSYSVQIISRLRQNFCCSRKSSKTSSINATPSQKDAATVDIISLSAQLNSSSPKNIRARQTNYLFGRLGFPSLRTSRSQSQSRYSTLFRKIFVRRLDSKSIANQRITSQSISLIVQATASTTATDLSLNISAHSLRTSCVSSFDTSNQQEVEKSGARLLQKQHTGYHHRPHC